jgi:hypothetical protein
MHYLIRGRFGLIRPTHSSLRCPPSAGRVKFREPPLQAFYHRVWRRRCNALSARHRIRRMRPGRPGASMRSTQTVVVTWSESSWSGSCNIASKTRGSISSMCADILRHIWAVVWATEWLDMTSFSIRARAAPRSKPMTAPRFTARAPPAARSAWRPCSGCRTGRRPARRQTRSRRCRPTP